MEHNVYTAYIVEDLPEEARYLVDRHGDVVLPALVFPGVEAADGSPTWQIKPATKIGERKYVSPSREYNPPKLTVVREVASPKVVLIVEGTKQALSASVWAPADWTVYRISGIWGWRIAGEDGGPGTPTPRLAVVTGQKVVIIPDSDAKTNPRVFDGAVALGEACDGYGATSVRFARLPGAGKDGVDDLLARVPEDRRTGLMESWEKSAKSKPADLDKRELARLRSAVAKKDSVKRSEAAASDERPGFDVGGDPRQLSLNLVEVLARVSGGTRLFRRDRQIVRVLRDDTDALRAGDLESDGLQREILDVAAPYRMVPQMDGPPEAVLVPVPGVLLGLVADHPDEFPPLAGISRSPIVRPDGTVVTANGYDGATGVLVDLSDDVVGMAVPEHPTDGDIVAARELLLDLFAMDGADGYDGWVFKTVADQTNAIAALLTGPVRASTGPSPLFVADGLEPGAGKGGLVETNMLLLTGDNAPMMPIPDSNAEVDKRITADLLAGEQLIALDEVQDAESGRCKLDSGALRAALTARTYRSRELGKSRSLSLPNCATWWALGNNVQIPADMARRVVPIQLDSDRPNLKDRKNFKYNLDTHVPAHRREYLGALLTLICAWYDRGQPEAPHTFGFASFTEWQRVVGGIVHLAGFKDFLGNVMTVREASDSESVDNRMHVEWLADGFPPGTRFAARDVLMRARIDGEVAMPPYGWEWDDLTAQKLSKYYGAHRSWYGTLRVRADGKMHGGGKAFVIDDLSSAPTSSSVTSAPAPPAPPAPGPRPAAGADGGETIGYTDRKGFRHDALRAMPPMTGLTISELAGGDPA
ncbi:DUF3854 domain-containing protein [Gordonia amicalis]|uniref:DUF3854 domain-containing protein n=1 Tax=Gordonia amicalis TaxID=89053 RepID=UPI0024B9B375|nr:DUF3854 domain-containing protein [Gordonia amicalis]MDJ0454067.1 DUF3854 domain-containing protein [Gordonia amicalis]